MRKFIARLLGNKEPILKHELDDITKTIVSQYADKICKALRISCPKIYLEQPNSTRGPAYLSICINKSYLNRYKVDMNTAKIIIVPKLVAQQTSYNRTAFEKGLLMCLLHELRHAWQWHTGLMYKWHPTIEHVRYQQLVNGFPHVCNFHTNLPCETDAREWSKNALNLFYTKEA